MFNVIIKTVIIYFFAMLIMRMMGKRQAGELQPFELIIAVMIAEVAATPMDSPGTPITYGIIPIVMLLVLHNGIAYLSLKSERLRAFFSGKPSIVIYKGVVVRHELKRLSYNLNDLIEQLRGKDVINLADVHYAVLETNGNLSVMLKPEKRGVTPEDMQLSPPNPGFCYDIIIDGDLKADNLKRLGFDESSLLKLLGQNRIKRVKDVFLALCDETGQALVQDYHGVQFTGSIANG